MFLSRTVVACAIVAAPIFVPELCAQAVIGTVPVGQGPSAVAVNPVTNKIYVVNTASGTVTVIDGATNASLANLTVGRTVPSSPVAVAINPLTNRIYVANRDSDDVSVIDGANDTLIVNVAAGGDGPIAIAVNSVTNRVYVANSISNDVTEIDGSNLSFVTSSAGGVAPVAIAVDPRTDRIYVAHSGSGDVTMLPGGAIVLFSRIASTLDKPSAIAMNPVTNRVYVANELGSVTVIDNDTSSVTTLTVGGTPRALAVNTVNNKIYVMRQGSNDVTVIAGLAISAQSVAVGPDPTGIAVDAATNQVYISNAGSGSVTVLDGRTDRARDFSTGGIGPRAIAVNPITSSVYVANEAGMDVTVINALANSAGSVFAGSGLADLALDSVSDRIYVVNTNSGDIAAFQEPSHVAAPNSPFMTALAFPSSIAVNPQTNRAYVASLMAASVNVIDTTTGMPFATVATGDAVSDVAINPITDRIYAANLTANSVTEIDGQSLHSNIIAGVSSPVALAVNPATDRLYAANLHSGTITVIDTANTPASVTQLAIAVGNFPRGIAVDAARNRIYVAVSGQNNITVIDGTTDQVVGSVPSGGVSPVGVAVNPATDRLYVINESNGAGNLAVIDAETGVLLSSVRTSGVPAAVAMNPLTGLVYVANRDGVVQFFVERSVQPLQTAIAPFVNDRSDQDPAFTFTASSVFSPNALPPNAVYYQLDSQTGPWTRAAGSDPNFTGATSGLSPGPHTVHAFATDGQDATAVGIASAITGAISSYTFKVVPRPITSTTTSLASSSNPAFVREPITLTASVSPAGATGTVEFFDGTASLGAPVPVVNNQAALVIRFPTSGSSSIRAIYSGDPAFGASTSSLMIQQIHEQIVPLLSWRTPAPITYERALSRSQLNATASDPNSGSSIPGSFAYTPDLGSILSAGPNQQLSVTFTPTDAMKYQSASTFVAIMVNRADPVMTWVPRSPMSFGTPLGVAQLNALAADSLSGDIVQGFSDYTPGSGMLLSAGTHALSVSFHSSDPNYNDATGTASVTVDPAGSAVVLASSSNPAVTGERVTFTTRVSTASAGIPVAGGVIFRDGSVTLGTAALNAGGAAFTTSAMSVGAHSITAQFVSSDANIGGSISADLLQNIITAPPDFSLTVSPTAISLAGGRGVVDGSTSAQVLLTIMPEAGFISTVDLTCAAMPQNAVSCRIEPASITPTGSPLSTVLQIGTSTIVASDRTPKATIFSLTVLLPAIAIVLLPLGKGRDQGLRLLGVLALLLFANSCGGGGDNGDNSSATRAATVVVTATATGGAPSHTANVVVSIVEK